MKRFVAIALGLSLVIPALAVPLGQLGNGVTAKETASGTGYILFSPVGLTQRFTLWQGQATHFAAVYRHNNTWYYYNNENAVAFTPLPTDALVAVVNFTADTASVLEGQNSFTHGIKTGYSGGDLGITVNWYGGQANDGEFTVTGTNIVLNTPQWWQTRGVINANAPNNFAVANLGQAKHMVYQAHAELLEANLSGGTGFALDSLFPAPPANPAAAWYEAQKAPLNLGQLKAVAKPFYDKLNSVSPSWVEEQLHVNGLSTLDTHYFKDNATNYYYPWNPTTPLNENLKLATIGQLKAVFALRFKEDRDADALPDVWEHQIINSSDVDGITSLDDVMPEGDFDNDGVDNLTEFQINTDPTVFSHSPVQWVSLRNVVVDNSAPAKPSLQKNSSGGFWHAGARSSRVLDGDGSVFASGSPKAMFGLGDTHLNYGYRQIDYAIYFENSQNVYIYENGVSRGLQTTYVSTDVFEVRRTGDTVEYFKNDQLFYTSTVSSSKPLYALVSIRNQWSTVSNTTSTGFTETLDTDMDGLIDSYEQQIVDADPNDGIESIADVTGFADFDLDSLSDAVEYDLSSDPLMTPNQGWIPVTWANHVDTTASSPSGYFGTSLAKTSGSNGYNAGATGSNTLPGDGGVACRVSALNSKSFIGLNISNDSASYTDLDYSIHFGTNGCFYVYENSTNKGLKGAYGLKETFSIEREGDTVYYKRNGKTFYTSAIKTTQPLIIDSSLYYTGNTLTHCVKRGFTEDPALDLDGDGIAYNDEYAMLSRLLSIHAKTIADITGSTDFDGDTVTDITEINNSTDPLSIYSGGGSVPWPTDALVAWYRMDQNPAQADGSGNVTEWKNSLALNDPNGLHIVPNNAAIAPELVQNTPFPLMRSLENDRTYVESSGSDFLSAETTGFTILGHFKPIADASNNIGGILNNEHYQNTGFRFARQTNTSDKLRWWSSQSGGNFSLHSKDGAVLNSPYQFTLSHHPDLTKRTSLYVNGEYQASKLDAVVKTNTRDMYLQYIGGHKGQPADWNELIIANRQLSQAEQTLLEDYLLAKHQNVGSLAGDTNNNGISDWQDIEGIGTSAYAPNHDSDDDGISDAEEYTVIARSKGTLNTLADVTPGGDLDADLVTNIVEYQSGTDMLDKDTDDDYVEDGPELQVSPITALSNRVNSSVAVSGVYQALSRDPSGATIAIVLDSPVQASQAKGVSNYSLDAFPVKSNSAGSVRYVDLDADGRLDLVTNGGASRLYAYRNTGSREHPVFDAEPVDLVGRLQRYIGGNYSDSSVIGSVDASFADVNGDGVDDLLCGESGEGQISYFLRTNAANVWPPQYASQQITFYRNSLGNDVVIEVSSFEGLEDRGMGSPALFDINDDGFKDLVVGDGLVQWIAFFGYPVYESSSNLSVYLHTQNTRVDGSPIYDAPVALHSESGPMFVQQGLGYSFAGGIARPTFIDADSDGDDDLFVSDTEGRVWLFKNTGELINDSNHANNGFYRFEAGILLRNSANEQIDFGSYAALDVADYEGDGDLDLISTGNALNGYERGDISVVRNVGSNISAQYDDHYAHIARKNAQDEFREGVRAKVSFWDMDNDGWKDMILGNSTGHLLVSINTDTGNDANTRFLEPLQLLDETGTPLMVEDYSVPIPVDFEGDGILDGLLVGAHTDVIYFEKSANIDDSGIPRFVNRGSVIEELGVTGFRLFPAVADLNGDGKLDVVVGNRNSGELFHLQNNSANSFDLAVAQKLQAGGADISEASTPVLFDVDKDGDLDLFAGSKVEIAAWPITGDKIRFYKNEGTRQAPTFASGVVLSPGGETIDIGDDVSPNYLDHDGDGKLDLVVANNYSEIRVYRNTTPESGEVSFTSDIILSKVGVSPENVMVGNGQASGQQVIYVTFPSLAGPGTTVDINELLALSDGQKVSFADLVIQAETDTDNGGAGDGLPDWWETILVNASTTDSINSLDDITPSADLDGDDTNNLDEYLAGTNALYFFDGDGFDADSDGLPDGWEIFFGLNPNSAADATVHTDDNDWLTPLQEYNLGLTPNTDDDADNDGWLDMAVANTLNSSFNDAYDSPDDILPWADEDADGFANAAEVANGTDPLSDSDPSTPAYTPLVDLNASALVAGNPLQEWSNQGSLGEKFTAGNQLPQIVDQGGVTCVQFSSGAEDWLKGPAEPSWISGGGSRTVAAWVYNPDVNTTQSDVIASWGGVAAASPEKSLFSVRHSSHAAEGALKLSGNGTGGQIWANNVTPVQGQWQFIVFRYNLQNGSLLVMQDFEAGISASGISLNTAIFKSDGQLQHMIIGGDSDAAGNITSQNTNLRIGRLYVYGESLPMEELLNLYNNDRVTYGRPDLSDANSDGVPDILKNSLQLEVNSQDTDGDGVFDVDELNRGTDPKDFYNGGAHYVEVSSGDVQSVTQGEETSEAITFRVLKADGTVIANAPVTLTVPTGGGQVRPDAGGQHTSNLSTSADVNGEVKIRFKSNE